MNSLQKNLTAFVAVAIALLFVAGAFVTVTSSDGDSEVSDYEWVQIRNKEHMSGSNWDWTYPVFTMKNASLAGLSFLTSSDANDSDMGEVTVRVIGNCLIDRNNEYVAGIDSYSLSVLKITGDCLKIINTKVQGIHVSNGDVVVEKMKKLELINFGNFGTQFSGIETYDGITLTDCEQIVFDATEASWCLNCISKPLTIKNTFIKVLNADEFFQFAYSPTGFNMEKPESGVVFKTITGQPCDFEKAGVIDFEDGIEEWSYGSYVGPPDWIAISLIGVAIAAVVLIGIGCFYAKKH